MSETFDARSTSSSRIRWIFSPRCSFAISFFEKIDRDVITAPIIDKWGPVSCTNPSFPDSLKKAIFYRTKRNFVLSALLRLEMNDDQPRRNTGNLPCRFVFALLSKKYFSVRRRDVFRAANWDRNRCWTFSSDRRAKSIRFDFEDTDDRNSTKEFDFSAEGFRRVEGKFVEICFCRFENGTKIIWRSKCLSKFDLELWLESRRENLLVESLNSLKFS